MVQDNDLYDIWYEDKKFEDEVSLKRWLAATGYSSSVVTREFSLGQTTTSGYVELMEDASETIEFPTENATVLIWQKTDQAADRGAVIYIKYVDEDGAVQELTTALDSSDSTTEVAVGADFMRLREFECANLVADEVLVGTTGAANVYGAIKVGCSKAAFSRYYTPADYRAFLIKSEAIGPDPTNPCTLKVTYQPKGEQQSIVRTTTAIYNSGYVETEYLHELEPEADLTFQITKASGDAGTMVVRYKLVEAHK